MIVYDNGSELESYFDKYKTLSDAKKESWVINMILLICFLSHIIMTSGLKIKNWIKQQKFVNNLLIYHQCLH